MTDAIDLDPAVELAVRDRVSGFYDGHFGVGQWEIVLGTHTAAA